MQRVHIKLSLIVFLALLFPGNALADGPPKRSEVIQVQKTAYIWVVGAWNFETCRILTDDIEIVPQYADVSALCGVLSTSMLNDGSANLYYLGKYEYLEDTPQDLPQIQIKSSVDESSVTVRAFDPLPDHDVIQIDAMINGIPAVCDATNAVPVPSGIECVFPVYNFPVLFSAFATSSYGDTSKSIELRIGNMMEFDPYFSEPSIPLVIVGDDAYTQYNIYHDIPRVWGVTPGTDIVPSWLKTVPVEGLETDHYYYYLAGQILLESPLEGQLCHNYGISGQYATNCGVMAVFEQTYQYQNAYNEEITVASHETGVPNRIIKRILAVESQFYPNAFGIAGERGLYQFTRDGADTLFRWNGPFYVKICGEYWDYCGQYGYDSLADWQRDVLINHVMTDPNNLYYLGSALKSNAYQITQVLDSVLGIEDPGGVLSYEDLWKITVLNYHAGPTLVSAVLVNMQELDLPISWESFATVLRDLQPLALQYVQRVYRGH